MAERGGPDKGETGGKTETSLEVIWMDADKMLLDAYHLGMRIAKTAYGIKHTPEGGKAATELLQQIADGETTFIQGNADFEAKYPGLSSGLGVLPPDQQVQVTNKQVREQRDLAQRIINVYKEFWGV